MSLKDFFRRAKPTTLEQRAGLDQPAPAVGPGLTDDPSDPDLGRHQPPNREGQDAKYLVLSEEERAKGYVEPVRRAYVHLKCGAVTTMGQAIAETYARKPEFYGGTFCVTCNAHFPVGENGEFVWDGTDQKVGTRRETPPADPA